MAERTKREKRLLFITVLLILGASGFVGVNSYLDYMGKRDAALEGYETRIRQQRAMLDRDSTINRQFEKIRGQHLLYVG